VAVAAGPAEVREGTLASPSRFVQCQARRKQVAMRRPEHCHGGVSDGSKRPRGAATLSSSDDDRLPRPSGNAAAADGRLLEPPPTSAGSMLRSRPCSEAVVPVPRRRAATISSSGDEQAPQALEPLRLRRRSQLSASSNELLPQQRCAAHSAVSGASGPLRPRRVATLSSSSEEQPVQRRFDANTSSHGASPHAGWLSRVQLQTTPRRRTRLFVPGSVEYEKHLLWRKANGLLDEQGQWVLHGELGASPNPPMPRRQWDALHLIYFWLDRNGGHAASVDQLWALDQSIVRRASRGQKLTDTLMIDVRPAIRGLRDPRDEERFDVMSPCVLPRSRLFWNKGRRFLTPGELLQLNGIFVEACPKWQVFPATVLASGAGNAFSMTVALAHLIIASARALASSSSEVAPAEPVEAASASLRLDSVTLAAITRWYLQRAGIAFATTSSASLGSSGASPSVLTLRFGTLCSGTDFVAAALPEICRQLQSLRGPSSPEIRCVHEFSAERDPRMRRFALENFGHPNMVCTDVTKLPEHMPYVDILIFGSSCKGLSLMNRKRRCLGHADPAHRLHSSGSTMAGCLGYVEKYRPHYVLLENVRGLLAVSRTLSLRRNTEVRNIDFVLDFLKSWGYTCSYTLVDARCFLLPQSRPRVWLWAELQGGPDALRCWPLWLQRMQSSTPLPLSDLLLSGRRK